ncbi:MAG: hypothetical protein KJ587_17200 [Alphaproteobacteria bacterium]|nr:hypothetical protein [Alphaproteobacteria bacterium]
MSPTRVLEAFLIGALLVVGSAVALTQTTGGAGSGAPDFVDKRQAPGLEEKAREEAARLAAEEERRRLVEEAEALRRKVEETQAKAEVERQRLAEEAEALRKAADEARRKAEAERLKREAAQKAAQEAAKAELEREETARREAAAAAERRQAEAEAEAAKRAAEAEQERQAAEREAARRRAEAEAEARKQAEADAAKRAAEAEQERRAAEREAARRRAEAEAEARKEAEADAAKRAAEAEQERQAAERARRAAEQAKQAADEEAARRSTDAADKCKGGTPPEIASRADAGGSMRIDIRADCQNGKRFSITYGPYKFVRAFDERGRASFSLDLFMGTRQPIALVLEGGEKMPIEPPNVDFSGLSKVAIAWKAPVNLDLHALEYLATLGGEGHIRAGAGSSFETARAMTAQGKGRGYMSSIAGNEPSGDKVEVYTLLRAPGQRSGVVTTLVDYETRGDLPAGDACGERPLAAIPFEVIELSPRGEFSVEKRQISPEVCGQALTQSERFNPDTIDDLQIRR